MRLRAKYGAMDEEVRRRFGPAGLPGSARVGRRDGARRGLDPVALRVAGDVPAAACGRASADLAASAPDAEAGVAEGGDGGDPSPSDGAPEPGEAEDPSAPAPVLRAAGAALPGGDHHRPADRRRRGAARRSAAPGQPGPAQAPATREAAQAQGLPGAPPRGSAGGGHRDRGAQRGAPLPVRLPRPAQPVRPGGGHAGDVLPPGPSPTSPSTCSPARWTGCSPTTARSTKGGSPTC